MFKLLALRVLDDCADHISKCLRKNVYYYFCTDFRFEISGKVYRGNRYLGQLQGDFYVPKQKYNFIEPKPTRLKININAIVGKNGDGKSSIVELAIRLINNYIAQEQGKVTEKTKFRTEQPLKYVVGVSAELYFQIEQNIYKLYNRENKCGVVRFAKIEDSECFDISNEDESFDVLDSIYTLVSNYSHYSYNIYDFRKEWDMSIQLKDEDGQNEACWLYHIFHKNDGYVTPISIHPFRRSGIIDINKEAYLSKQRLLYLFVKSSDGQNAFRNILGKQAVGIRLTPSSRSKLLDHSIRDFFYANIEEDNSLDWPIFPIENLVLNIKGGSQETGMTGLYDKIELCLKEVGPVLSKIIEGSDFPKKERSNYKEFLEYITQILDRDYVEKRGKKSYKYRSSDTSNIQSLGYAIGRLYEEMPESPEMSSFMQKFNDHLFNKTYAVYNLRQLSRLHTIYSIAIFYKIDTKLLLKPYEKLTNKQRAQIYKIYKTLTIFETYPKYKEQIQTKEKKKGVDICIEYNKSDIKKLIKQLSDDIINNSHVTRKLVQVDNYLNQNDDIFQKSDMEIPQLNKESSTQYIIKDINCLSQYYGEKNVDIFHLIPPVFEYDIILKDGNSYVELNSLSSGEKQLLHSIGAIIYHVQNIDSTQVYQSINMVLEEIELYFHPEYQRLFISRLLEQLYGINLTHIRNINITFVTHSPFVLSDIPKCNVLFLRDGEPDYEMQENTFGANIHSLLKNGFFLPNLLVGEFAHMKINELFRQLNSGDYEKSEENIEKIRQEISVIGEPYLREQLFRLLRIR